MRKILMTALLASLAASPAFAAQDGSTGRGAQRAQGVSRWTRDTIPQPGDSTYWTRDPLQRAGETERWTRDRVSDDSELRAAQAAEQAQPRLSEEGGSRPRKTAQAHPQKRISWNRDWRNEARYDWRRYRETHRSAFQLGAYVDPFGFGYRPFAAGYHLGPAYYGQRYRFDPAIYSLPPSPPGTQWVRYWNDALLVDIYSGQVVDVIHDFFW